MKFSSLGPINIAAVTRRLDVDHKISLRFYYRIADNILRQVTTPLLFKLVPAVIHLGVQLRWFPPDPQNEGNRLLNAKDFYNAAPFQYTMLKVADGKQGALYA